MPSLYLSIPNTPRATTLSPAPALPGTAPGQLGGCQQPQPRALPVSWRAHGYRTSSLQGGEDTRLQDQGRCPWQHLPGRKSCWLRAAFFSGLQEDANVSTATETGARAKACDNTPQYRMQHVKASPASSLHSQSEPHSLLSTSIQMAAAPKSSQTPQTKMSVTPTFRMLVGCWP